MWDIRGVDMNLWENTLKWLRAVYEDNKDRPVIAMVSGGPDSRLMVELILNTWPREMVHMLHVNHLYRPGSHRETAFVRRLACDNNVSFHLHTDSMVAVSKKRGISLEQAGRAIRLEASNNLMKELPNAVIATGHHEDDQVETIFMRIVRGTGMDGLVGIIPWDGYKLRPLRFWKKTEILDFCNVNGMEYVEDESNFVADVTRNILRLEVLPILRERLGKDINDSLLRLGNIALADKKFWENRVQLLFSQHGRVGKEGIFLNREIVGLQFAESSRLIRYSLSMLEDGLWNVGFEHIKAVVEQILTPGSWQMDLPGEIRVYAIGDEILFRHGIWTSKIPEAVDLKGGINVTPWGAFILEQESNLSDRQVQVFDMDKLPGKIVVRSRKNGDVFYPVGMKGSKKLKDYFIDEKIPALLRDRVPLIESGGDLIWVVGYRADGRYLATEHTKNPLTIVYREGNHEW